MCPDLPDSQNPPAAVAAEVAANGASHGGARAARHALDGEFALHSGEPLAHGLRRLLLEQVDGIIAMLAPGSEGLDERAVHESRKALKRLRALARLLRPELGDGYDSENQALRDAARRLAGARDAEVLAATLQDVCERNAKLVRHDTFATLAAHLRGERRLAEAHLLSDEGAIGDVTGELRAVRERADGWLSGDVAFDAVAPGLERVYGQGAQRFRRARSDPSIERLHDWRKRVKDLRHAAEALEPANPKRMGAMARCADRIGERLGDDHDLAMLEQLTHDRPELFASTGERKLLRKLVRRRRARLQRKAMRLGARLYKSSAHTFATRVARDWQRHAGV